MCREARHIKRVEYDPPLRGRRLTRTVRQEMNTPEKYRKYMADGGATSGELSSEPGWFELWPAGQLDELNTAYKTQEFVPGFWGFGSNGGDELFAFDTNGCVFMLPFVPMEEKSAVKVADSWDEFQDLMK